jgi:hypothetical protein
MKLLARMTSLSMVSTTSQGDEQPCSRELGGIGLDGQSIGGTSGGSLVQSLVDNNSVKALE